MRWPALRASNTLYTPALLLLVVIVGISYLGLGFISPLRALYGREVGASSAEIGFMAAAAMLSGILATPAVGRLGDRFGQKRVLWVGLLMHALLTLAYIPAQHPFWLILIRALEGVAIASVLPPARALANLLAPADRQAEALGVLGAAKTVGILIGPAAGSVLAAQTGYTPSFLLASVPLVLGALATLVFLPRTSTPQSTSTVAGATPQSRGTLRQKGTAASKGEPLVAPATVPVQLFTRPLVLAYVMGFVLALNGGIGMAVWSLFMSDHGASLPVIGLSYTTFAVPIIVLAPLSGRISDRYGRYWPAVVGFALCALVFGLYVLPLSPWWIVIISGFEGIPVAIAGSAADGLLADSTPAEARSRVQANFGAAGNAGSLVAATGAGFLYAFAPGMPFLALAITYVGMTLALLLPALARIFAQHRQPVPVGVAAD
ncbi:MAG TPA: MFS transporter [Ktedonobacterales bacterium]|jgi:MFS family permease